MWSEIARERLAWMSPSSDMCDMCGDGTVFSKLGDFGDVYPGSPKLTMLLIVS